MHNNINETSRNSDYKYSNKFNSNFRNDQRSFRGNNSHNVRRYDRTYDRPYEGPPGRLYDRPHGSSYDRPHGRSYDRSYDKPCDRPHNRPYDRPSDRPYNRQSNNGFRSSFKNYKQYREQRSDVDEVHIPPSPLEVKIERLVNAVKSESLISAKIVFMINSHELENPVILLENAVNTANLTLKIAFNEETKNYELKINNEKFAETPNFITKQMLKSKLCETAMDDLKKKCFYIIKKKNYEEVKTGITETANKKDDEPEAPSSMVGSKAHQMMLKMGWGGKGLGANEQGEEKTVAEKLTQNVTKEGLGNNSIMTEVEEILKNFAYSTKFTILAFDPSFTKEERAFIHNLALKYNLKSKSEGKNENRRITLSKKIEKWDLVKELLRNVELENESYKLVIPKDFQTLWETT